MRKTLLLALALIGCLVGIGILAMPQPPDQKIYQGKKLHEWVLLAMANDPQAEATLKSLGAESIPGLRHMLHAKDLWWRKQMLDHSGAIPRPLRIRLLRTVPHVDAASIRAAAAHGFGLLGPVAVPEIPGLLAALRDPESRVAWEAARALARVGAPAVPGLISNGDSPSESVRHGVAFALGEIGPDASQGLGCLSGMLRDSSVNVRVSAANSIVLVGTSISAPLPEDPEARQGARRIRLMHERSLHGYVEPMIEMIRSEDPWTRHEGVTLLAGVRVTSDAALSALTNSLTDPDKYVRLASCRALGQLGERSEFWIAALVTRVADPVPEVRACIAQVLAHIGTSVSMVMPALEHLERDSNSEVRLIAQAGLRHLSSVRLTKVSSTDSPGP